MASRLRPELGWRGYKHPSQPSSTPVEDMVQSSLQASSGQSRHNAAYFIAPFPAKKLFLSPFFSIWSNDDEQRVMTEKRFLNNDDDATALRTSDDDGPVAGTFSQRLMMGDDCCRPMTTDDITFGRPVSVRAPNP